ncbi:MAG: M1 family metallopeptidase [Rubricoccaceae bacterium]|nr:M1 family metallopeptidase [Rubricoccaceae bacterium]
MPPPQFERAVEQGTRSADGTPGPNYWQNRADYTIEATLDPSDNTLSASGTIRYTNASPNALPYLVLKLRQNVHKEGVPRNRFVEITGGLALRDLAVDGQPVEEVTEGLPEPGQYRIDGTVLTLALADTLETGETATLSMGWRYRIPNAEGAFRQGTDGEVYYVAYWYPQVAVYDDVYGWHTDQYLGLGEHYMGFGDYEVEITAPEGFLVWSTGRLDNPEAVLAPETLARLDRAYGTDEVVSVVSAGQRAPGRSTADSPDDRLTWRFVAENVRDVAFGASDRYVWDATHAGVDQDGDGDDEAVLINALYRPDAAAWGRAAEFGRFSVEHLSEMFFPYPYPHMTAVEGLIGGGMEYPMMTLIGGTRNDQSLFGVTYHEISHMWFPMIVGSNEKAYTWMDEGLTSYNTNVGLTDFFDGSSADRPEVDGWARNRQYHYYIAGTGYAVEPMRHNDLYPLGGGTPQVDPVQNASRGVASYSTPAVLLRAIEGIYGTDRFLDAYREYAQRWAFKHPYPWDLFNTFEDVLGEDLDWLWTPTLFESWTVDLAVAEVEEAPGDVRVQVVDEGLAPMPAPVTVTYADGRTETQTVPVQTWLGGAREASLTFPAGDAVRVEVDAADVLIDVDRTNNVWTDPSSEGGVNSSN